MNKFFFCATWITETLSIFFHKSLAITCLWFNFYIKGKELFNFLYISRSFRLTNSQSGKIVKQDAIWTFGYLILNPKQQQQPNLSNWSFYTYAFGCIRDIWWCCTWSNIDCILHPAGNLSTMFILFQWTFQWAIKEFSSTIEFLSKTTI